MVPKSVVFAIHGTYICCKYIEQRMDPNTTDTMDLMFAVPKKNSELNGFTVEICWFFMGPFLYNMLLSPNRKIPQF